MALIDMALTTEEAKKEDCCIGSSDGDDANRPKYPYGLSLNLDAVTMKKLGITEMPKVGEPMHLMAVVEVCSTSQYENQGGSEMNVSLQITKLDLQQDGPDAADALYGA